MFKRILSLASAVAVAITLAACGKVDSAVGAPSAPGAAFKILAGSELKDVAPLVTAYGAQHGVQVTFEYTGSLDAIDRVSEAHTYDALWLSNGKYLQLIPGLKGQVKASEKTFYSRVVLGVRSEKAKELGWVSGKTSWSDVVKASKDGKFRFGMANPAASNTGFVALVGLAAELSGKGDALEAKDIPVDALKNFFSRQSITSGSSGDLADKFVADPSKADGLINYESVILGINAKGAAKLDVLIPKEGVITADYPLMLMSGSKSAEFYGQLVEHLRNDDTQQRIASTTFRRPLAGVASDEVVNELPFPGSLAVVDAILQGFGDVYSRPASSFFVLDISGSMSGARLAALKQGMTALTNADVGSGSRFSTFRAREELTISPFNHEVYESRYVALTDDPVANKVALRSAGQYVESLVANGGTAIYNAARVTYQAAQARARSGERSVSIVLLTDGENATGINADTFKAFVKDAGEPRIPVFAVAYGDANFDELQGLSAATGGKVFDARSTSLARVLKTIRAYQ
ncbi:MULTISPECIES: substrate-binding and vWA domain-containing protein [unclassified Variovorax]|uniref:substrate-binding and vWA domain-containing protein n=1 Tax=unclassified Variovorax TaxID=663243 RepID=UPI00131713BB|nr:MULTISPECIES: substrate-binding and VWA domain-containing protein [unclassified Variovorax]VTU42934.1 marine proteobacterial sortase target protein [Variovorax sp. PBL-H6]VTU43575.1 marine proteobacterial sortase target protein [Variovorax sp. SRS16]VTU43636.1 marine proteobacterial sortase target protein [Variovorax sp. PBL-E5]